MDAKNGIDSQEYDEFSKKNAPLLVDLAKIEHPRRNTFCAIYGYKAMDKEIYKKRLKDISLVDQDDKPQQDTGKLLHVCLVSWDELPELDKAYEEAVQKALDKAQQQKDIENIKSALVSVSYDLVQASSIS